MDKEKEAILAELTAISGALQSFPRMPDPLALFYLGSIAPIGEEFSNRGQIIQRELGLEKIPPNCESEIGAGFWDFMTNGAWRNESGN